MDSVILGGIIGAGSTIITIIVTKFFDYKQQKQEHNLYLKKEFFLKKLNAYENATIYWSTMTTSMSNLSTLLDCFSNEDINPSNEGYKNIANNIDNGLVSVSKSTVELASAVELYFDTTQVKSNNIVERLYTVVGEIHTLVDKIKHANDMYAKASGISDDFAEKMLDSIEDYEIELDDKIEDFKELSGEISKYFNTILDLFRKDLAQYK